MNTELRFVDRIFPAQELGGESSLPPLLTMSRHIPTATTNASFGEDNNLFVGYGFVRSPFPYRAQDRYTRPLRDTAVFTAVLENEYLRAEFVPSYGGKLWSLYDKKAGRDLLLANPVIRPCNLAIRNAWTSGGVEWNCGGYPGHHPHTCSPLFTARTALDDGTPVLRMYEYERLRRVVWQMDFFLPEGSRMLYARMRVVNTQDRVVPMYWWSNIAAPEIDGARVIVPAEETYTAEAGGVGVLQIPVPERDMWKGTDITYPVNLGHSVDFFWKIPDRERKFTCQLDRDGYGLVQTSTDRLQGRKLFVWGQGPGGDRWQQYLTADDSDGRYVELQAGLAHTQYETIPMNPKGVWEWVEAYGALQCDPALIHGDWKDAKAEAAARLEAIQSRDGLEKLLADTKPMALRPAEKPVVSGSGFGALENRRRVAAQLGRMTPHLDFGETGDQQALWVDLLTDGSVGQHDPDEAVPSWMLEDDWLVLLDEAVKGRDRFNWMAHLQRGMTLLAQGRFDEGEAALERSMELTPSAWALFGLACAARVKGDGKHAAAMLLSAAEMKRGDESLAKAAARLLSETGGFEALLRFYDGESEEIRMLPRMRLYAARAMVKTGREDEAEEILTAQGGLLVPDIQEGEVSMTELWYEIQEARAKKQGREFRREDAEVPAMFDFRMGAEKKKKK